MNAEPLPRPKMSKLENKEKGQKEETFQRIVETIYKPVEKLRIQSLHSDE